MDRRTFLVNAVGGALVLGGCTTTGSSDRETTPTTKILTRTPSDSLTEMPTASPTTSTGTPTTSDGLALGEFPSEDAQQTTIRIGTPSSPGEPAHHHTVLIWNDAPTTRAITVILAVEQSEKSPVLRKIYKINPDSYITIRIFEQHDYVVKLRGDHGISNRTVDVPRGIVDCNTSSTRIAIRQDGTVDSTTISTLEGCLTERNSETELVIDHIVANAEGDDNENLNEESVTLALDRSSTSGRIESLDLSGYIIHYGDSGQTFMFPETTIISIGEIFVVRTGQKPASFVPIPSAVVFFAGFNSPVLDNDGGTVIVTDDSGTEVASKKY